MNYRNIYLPMILFACTALSCIAQTPVEIHGQLSVKGNHVVDKNNQPIQLRGVSLFWSQWIGKYYQEETVKWLIDDWNINIIRAAMAVDQGGYARNESEKEKIFSVVDAAIKHGIYVIIDFHAHHADKYVKESQTFFDEVSKRYGKFPNVMYEPWNEPISHSWETVIKPYHENIITTIRKNDPDNLIICGTRDWAQQVEEASLNPIEGSNIVYALHYYAGTHKQELRDNAARALKNGVALMVTEYGTCESTGSGPINETETRAWWSFLDENKISHCSWSVSDKRETASILVPGTKRFSKWKEEELSPSGKLVREEIRSKNATVTHTSN
jgi:endoglucanase